MTFALNSPKKRIFIKRENTDFRNILNQEEFDKLIFKYGFEIYVLDKLSLQEQINLFNNSSIIIGVHGAGLTNMLFCSPESTIIELGTKSFKNVTYWIQANNLQLNYHIVYCESDTPECDSQNFNISVNLELLEKHINYAITKNNT
jgi:capsular polysaccharide biosynthesis protein